MFSLGGFCPGVFGKGGVCPGGFCLGVYVREVFVRGVFLPEPFYRPAMMSSVFSIQDQFCPFWDQFCGFAYIIRLVDHFCLGTTFAIVHAVPVQIFYFLDTSIRHCVMFLLKSLH